MITPHMAAIIAARVIIANTAEQGDRFIDLITERCGVELTETDSKRIRAALTVAAAEVHAGIRPGETTEAFQYLTDKGWEAAEAPEVDG